MSYDICDTLTASSDGWKPRGDRKQLELDSRTPHEGPYISVSSQDII